MLIVSHRSAQMGLRLKKRGKNSTYAKEVAKIVGISERQYQYYEREERVPNAVTAVKIAKALKTTVEILYHG